MGQLLFKKCFWDAIRAGTKRTTLRRWDRPRAKAGDRAFAPGVGWLRVTAVDVVELDDLADADAIADGFDSRSAMREALDEIYPDHATDGKRWYRVAFEWEGEATPKRPAKAKR
jgi:hypothetical protein